MWIMLVIWCQSEMALIIKSCRAFSISEGLESCYAITYNKPVMSLSTQQFISCDNERDSYGCNGGTLQAAVDWLIKVV